MAEGKGQVKVTAQRSPARSAYAGAGMGQLQRWPSGDGHGGQCGQGMCKTPNVPYVLQLLPNFLNLKSLPFCLMIT